MIAPLSPIEVAGGMILGDEVHARIGAAILDGTLRPGQRLRDVDLARQLGVSRTPVREALQRLERFGLVEIAVGRYTRVSTPANRLRDETGEFTAYLMGNALRIALQRCSDDQHAAIVALADAVVAAALRADAVGLFEASTEMFVEVTKATGNAMFIGVIREAALAIQRNLHAWRPFLAGPLSRNEGYVHRIHKQRHPFAVRLEAHRRPAQHSGLYNQRRDRPYHQHDGRQAVDHELVLDKKERPRQAGALRDDDKGRHGRGEGDRGVEAKKSRR